jgi:ABC-type multidrug transport system fused ATPase/permease subunit
VGGARHRDRVDPSPVRAGLALALSVWNVYFRDLEYLVGIALQFWFYASPIVYPLSQVEDALADRPAILLDLYRLNPMTQFAEIYRDLLYDLRAPSLGAVAYVIGCALVSFAIGWTAFPPPLGPARRGALMAEPAITVEHLSKRFRLYHDRNQSLKAAVMRGGRARYEEFWALRDVSLEIAEGTTYGFIGTNGSGKSTLLKCLARILEPDEGRSSTRGKVSALLELGAGFHPELSGRENIYLNGSILGLSKADLDLRYDDIVEFAGLERFIDTP